MRLIFVCSYCNKQHQSHDKCGECEMSHFDGEPIQFTQEKKDDKKQFDYRAEIVKAIELNCDFAAACAKERNAKDTHMYANKSIALMQFARKSGLISEPEWINWWNELASSIKSFE